jgi:hypothetical protein
MPLERRSIPFVAVVEVLRCPVCNAPRSFSPEHEHRVRAGKAKLTACADCRRPRHPRPTQRDYDFWTSRFSNDEITAMGRAIFG